MSGTARCSWLIPVPGAAVVVGWLVGQSKGQRGRKARIEGAIDGRDRLARGEDVVGGVDRADHPDVADYADDLAGGLLGGVGLDPEDQPVVGVARS